MPTSSVPQFHSESQGHAQGQVPSNSDLPPIYTPDGPPTQDPHQHQQQHQDGTSTPIAPGAHWSPYDSTANLAHTQLDHPHPPSQQQQHPHPHPHPHLRHPQAQAHTAMGLTSPFPSSHPHPHKETHKEHLKPSLSIILDTPFLTLKGTGPDVEPTTLSGHVVLFLTEPTALKELTLQFRGKARIPMPANESLINSATSITYVVCNHDWSFLESPDHPSTSSTSTSTSSKRHTHSRTLKAGKHYFPFSLSIGGSLPSSISTPLLGGASVAYKLRALATRPGLSSNLQCILPVPLVRGFTTEALEYQQTLEIENTWPEKLMYAVMLPHKAWAAGEVLGAVVKFVPLGKGVRVVSVGSALWESVKCYARSGPLEEGRVVCSSRCEIVYPSPSQGGRGGEEGPRRARAVEVEYVAGMLGGGAAHAATVGLGGSLSRDRERERDRGEGSSTGHTAHSHHGHGHGHGPQRLGSAFSNLAHIVSSHGSASSSKRNLHDEPNADRDHEHSHSQGQGHGQDRDQEGPSHHHHPEQSPAEEDGYENNDVVTYIKLRIPFSAAPNPRDTPPGGHSPASGSLPGTGTSTPITPGFPSSTAGSSSSTPPAHPIPNVLVTPSHALEPITVTHRIKWSIYIRNRDGHISELRCSLPLVILDGRLREEARDASLLSRRMMARSCGIVPERGDEELWGFGGGHGVDGIDGGAEAEGGEGMDDRELPSYNAHVRDRVANMFLPEAVTMRVSNPWLGRVSSAGSSPLIPATPAAGDLADPLSTSTVPSTAPSASTTEDQLQHQGGGSSAGTSGRNTRRNSSYLALDASHLNLNLTTHAMSQLPHLPASGSSTPLDWVNSELLLSLGDDSLARFGVDSAVGVVPAPGSAGPGSAGAGGVGGGAAGGAGDGAITPLTPAGVRTPPPPAALQYVSSGPGSRSGSRWGSRAGSRAGSPERSSGGGAGGGSGGGGEHYGSRRQSGDYPHPHAHGAEGRMSRPGSPSFGGSSNGGGGGGGGAPGPAAMGYMYEPLPGASSTSASAAAGHASSSHAEHPHAHGHNHGHTHGHGHNHHHHGRLGSFFKATMKPFTALSSHSHKHKHDEKDSHNHTQHTHTHHTQHNHTHRSSHSHSGPSHSGPSHTNSGPSSREGSPTTRSGVPPRRAPFHASQPDLSLPSSMAMTSAGRGGPQGPQAQGQGQGQGQTGAGAGAALSTSRSTSNLPAMRLAAASAAYGASGHPQSPYGPLPFSMQPLTSSPTMSSPTATHPPPTTSTLASTTTSSSTPGFPFPQVPAPFSTTHPNAPQPHPPPLHRALTEVPDYAIASRGFLGGVPPLSSMRGLPSYEEAVSGSRGGNGESSSAADANAGAGTTGSTAPAPAPAPGSSQAPGHSSLSRSEPDIAGRFARVRILEPVSPRGHAGGGQAGVQAQGQARASASGGRGGEDGDEEEDGDGEEDEEEDEGIQMRSRSPRS